MKMTDREKLIALIDKSGSHVLTVSRKHSEEIADFLIENGVRIDSGWISVADRLPETERSQER